MYTFNFKTKGNSQNLEECELDFQSNLTDVSKKYAGSCNWMCLSWWPEKYVD